MAMIQTIASKQLDELRRSNKPIELIDVRTPVEFREVHADMARNIPLDSLDPHAVMGQRHDSGDKTLYVICRSGSRAKKACEAFVLAGYTNVVSVEGGTLAWEQAGLPVVRGKKAISLERQVRIVAGLLVGIGTRYGSGCTSGHGVCGLSRLSLRSLAATMSFMAAGFVTVYVIRHLMGV